MAYDRINWENTPSHVTPLSAENLNTMDEAIDNIDEELNRVGVKAVNLEARMDTAETNITNIDEELTEQDTYAKGMGTKTLQHETDIAELQGQVTQIISGAPASPSEVTDIRVAENGTTYDTAGNAVRAQVRQMIEVQDTQPTDPGNKLWIDDGSYDSEDRQVPTWDEFEEVRDYTSVPITWDVNSDGKYIGANGAIGSSGDFHYSNLLPAAPGDAIFSFDYNGGQMAVRIHGYTENGTWTQQLGYAVNVVSGQTINFEIPVNVKYIRISISASATNTWYGVQIINALDVIDDYLSRITGNKEIQFSNPSSRLYIITNGSTINPNNPSVSTVEGRKYAVVECEPGDVFTLTCSSATYPRAWAFGDANNNNIACARNFANSTNIVIVAPENAAYLVINALNDDKCYRGNLVNTHISDIDSRVKSNTKNINCGGSNVFDPNSSEIENGGFYTFSSSAATLVWNANASYSETGYMSVEPGKSFCAIYADSGTETRNIPFLFFDKNKQLINEYTNPSESIKVPIDAAYLRVPVLTARKQYFVVLLGETYQGEYVEPYITPKAKINSIQSQIDVILSQRATGEQWNGKTWYAYGTSITANNGSTVTTGKYPAYLAEMSGMVLTNKGIGGGGIGNFGAYSTGQVYNAICNTSDGKTSADLITLETGANDVNADVPLGSVYDTGQTTLSGCLNDCLRYLQKNTNAQIVVTCSPASTTAPTASGKYYEWAKMVEEICHINRVHFINADNNMGYAKLSDSVKGGMYAVDNIHQTDLGGYIMAQNIWSQLRNIPLFYTAIPSN